MIDFTPVQKEARDEISEYLRCAGSRSCDMAFATIYLWRSYYNMEYAVCEGNLITRSRKADWESYSFPIGKEDPYKTVCTLIGHCRELGIPFVMNSITEREKIWLETHFPGQFDIRFHRDYADYIYGMEALISLKGKRYHGKRNHINKFMRTYDWAYEPVTDENLPECLALLEDWQKDNAGKKEESELLSEVYVSKTALMEREFLGLSSGLIRADGKVVAFSLGEQVYDDTFCIHVEKAYADVPGAYAMINQQFLIHEAAGYRYVNREDDVGDPGIRKAKLSYHPAFLLEKGIAIYM